MRVPRWPRASRRRASSASTRPRPGSSRPDATTSFAAAVWCDPGIVFDEKRGNVNYWEPWYLGLDPAVTRGRGIVSKESPRTGPYKTLYESGHDLVELHALMAPRPFLVSGGTEDHAERWQALNHLV